MPGGRVTRQRIAAGENDENGPTMRTTRAKAAAMNAEEPAKAALQPRKAGVNAAPTAARRRAALGDVSNVGKGELAEGKKAGTSRAGLVSKAAQPTGVQKTTSARAAGARTAAAKKEAKATEVKRTGSGSGVIGAQSKRKAPATSAASVGGDDVNDENERPRKMVHTEPEKAGAKIPEEPAKPAAAVAPEPVTPAPKTEEEVEAALPPGVRELELDDKEDPFMVSEYATEIFDYMRELEVRTMPNPSYMNDQDDLEWKLRGILIDWLIDVHTRFHLLPETLFLTVNIIDRFLSAKVVHLDRLQLVGVTAMYIAAKYEEVLSPHVSNFQRATDDSFTDEEILDAERFMLGVLGYNLSYPNPMNFLRRVSKADNYDFTSRSIGKFLMEISLVDHRFMTFPPSLVAAAAMFLSRLILDRGDWDDVLSYYAGHNEDDIEPVVRLMIDYLARPIVHEAFFKKYANRKFLKASLITRKWAKLNAVHFGIKDTFLSLDQL